MSEPAVAIGGNPLAAPVWPAIAQRINHAPAHVRRQAPRLFPPELHRADDAAHGVLSAFQRADLGRIVMLFGFVGHACWHVPQPVHPSRTLMRPSSATINARAPTGQASTQ